MSNCLLLIIYYHIGTLSDIIYVQIDGGSENIAKAVILMCELIVIKGLCKTLVHSKSIDGWSQHTLWYRWCGIRTALEENSKQSCSHSRRSIICKLRERFSFHHILWSKKYWRHIHWSRLCEIFQWMRGRAIWKLRLNGVCNACIYSMWFIYTCGNLLPRLHAAASMGCAMLVYMCFTSFLYLRGESSSMPQWSVQCF